MQNFFRQFKLIDLVEKKRLNQFADVRSGQTAEIAVDISGFSKDEARTRTGRGYGLDTD
jgi:hypothetical protein